MKKKFSFSDPVLYNLSIRGELSMDSLEIISNFFKGSINCEHINTITYLEGVVKDQIALSGLLSYLCDLHCILLSVRTINKHSMDEQQ